MPICRLTPAPPTIAAALTVYRELPGLSNYFLILGKAQLIAPRSAVLFPRGVINPSPPSEAELQPPGVKETHANTTADSLHLALRADFF